MPLRDNERMEKDTGRRGAACYVSSQGQTEPLRIRRRVSMQLPSLEVVLIKRTGLSAVREQSRLSARGAGIRSLLYNRWDRSGINIDAAIQI